MKNRNYINFIEWKEKIENEKEVSQPKIIKEISKKYPEKTFSYISYIPISDKSSKIPVFNLMEFMKLSNTFIFTKSLDSVMLNDTLENIIFEHLSGEFDDKTKFLKAVDIIIRHAAFVKTFQKYFYSYMIFTPGLNYVYCTPVILDCAEVVEEKFINDVRTQILKLEENSEI